LRVDDIDHKIVSAFLDHLERERRRSPATRNARLAAIRSFYRYAALEHPEHAATIERVLPIPLERTDRPLVTWLTKPELDVLLGAPDPRTWTGRRDRVAECPPTAVPDPHQRRAHAGRARPPAGQVRDDRRRYVSVAGQQGGHAACAQAHRGNAAAAREDRHVGDRVVVRERGDPDQLRST
jgi:integrase